MLTHQLGPSNGDAPWSSYYNDEYATTTHCIQIGMTRQQVTNIIGGPGRVVSESQILHIHTVMIIYQGRFWSPKSATLTFYNGLL
ncbi:unnamed protein product [Rotaria magnacalcarata]|uniref:Uncharacterized protein n=1 Tax=Rotaria magnacalcarata TaxID=392030 RepID=A0A819U274_9BILA|nr:unnamed protein product [Rotaria magnacalcarata]CAF4087680.1 unnamed protein product [Rotaria magnacalcarata]